MDPDDTTAPVWRVVYNTYLEEHFVDRAGLGVSRYESAVCGGLTYVEARALRDLLNSGEQDGRKSTTP